MAGNKPINKPLRGIRDSMPPGYILGRTGSGNGPPILIPAGTFTTKGYVANTTIQVNGPAGGDLSGTYPNPIVTGIQGIPIAAGTPLNGQIFVYNSSLNQFVATTVGFPASTKDDGTTFFLAIIDPDGQLVLDSTGDPIFAPEVLPPSALSTPKILIATNTEIDGPSTHTGTDGLMVGAGSTYTFTPGLTGKIRISGTFVFFITNVTASARARIRYGTGTPPATGAAATGTIILTNPFKATVSINNEQESIGFTILLTGLTPGTTYWLDYSTWSDNAGGAGPGDVQIQTNYMLVEEVN